MRPPLPLDDFRHDSGMREYRRNAQHPTGDLSPHESSHKRPFPERTGSSPRGRPSEGVGGGPGQFGALRSSTCAEQLIPRAGADVRTTEGPNISGWSAHTEYSRPAGGESLGQSPSGINRVRRTPPGARRRTSRPARASATGPRREPDPIPHRSRPLPLQGLSRRTDPPPQFSQIGPISHASTRTRCARFQRQSQSGREVSVRIPQPLTRISTQGAGGGNGRWREGGAPIGGAGRGRRSGASSVSPGRMPRGLIMVRGTRPWPPGARLRGLTRGPRDPRQMGYTSRRAGPGRASDAAGGRRPDVRHASVCAFKYSTSSSEYGSI